MPLYCLLLCKANSHQYLPKLALPVEKVTNNKDQTRKSCRLWKFSLFFQGVQRERIKQPWDSSCPELLVSCQSAKYTLKMKKLKTILKVSSSQKWSISLISQQIFWNSWNWSKNRCKGGNYCQWISLLHQSLDQ